MCQFNIHNIDYLTYFLHCIVSFHLRLDVQCDHRQTQLMSSLIVQRDFCYFYSSSNKLLKLSDLYSMLAKHVANKLNATCHSNFSSQIRHDPGVTMKLTVEITTSLRQENRWSKTLRIICSSKPDSTAIICTVRAYDLSKMSQWRSVFVKTNFFDWVTNVKNCFWVMLLLRRIGAGRLGENK